MRRLGAITLVLVLVTGCRLGSGPKVQIPLSIACPERYTIEATAPADYVITNEAALTRARSRGGGMHVLDRNGNLQFSGSPDAMYSRPHGREVTSADVSIEHSEGQACPESAAACFSETCMQLPGCPSNRIPWSADKYLPAPSSIDELRAMMNSRFVDDGNCRDELPASWCRAQSNAMERREMMVWAIESCASIGGCDDASLQNYSETYRAIAHYRFAVPPSEDAVRRVLAFEFDPAIAAYAIPDPWIRGYWNTNDANEIPTMNVRWIDAPDPRLALELSASAGATLYVVERDFLSDRRISGAKIITWKRRAAEFRPADLAFRAAGVPPYELAFGAENCPITSGFIGAPPSPELRFASRLEATDVGEYRSGPASWLPGRGLGEIGRTRIAWLSGFLIFAAGLTLASLVVRGLRRNQQARDSCE